MIHPRLMAVFAAVAAVFLSVQATNVRGEAYALKEYGAAASVPSAQTPRYEVQIVDLNWYDAERGRNVPALIYYPKNAAQKFPVIVFSTGLGRSRDDCAYLGRHWASCGYVAVHVQHKGSDEDVRQGTLRPRKELQKAFYASNNIRNRPMDVIFAINQLERMQREKTEIGQRLDMTRIGVSGHDFGAQTVLALAGQVLPGKMTFSEPRVKAVVAMSSPVPLGQVPLDEAYKAISVPCLHITGTADNSIVATTQASQRRLPFDHMSGADQYLVTFNGADHMTYSGHLRAKNSGSDGMFQRRIAECSAVFWDAYLKDDAAAKAWLAGDTFKSYLASTGWIEKKLVP